jgi:hypothetical protein
MAKLPTTPVSATPSRPQIPQATQAAVNANKPLIASRHFRPSETLPEIPDTKDCHVFLALWKKYQHIVKIANLDPAWHARINEIRKLAFDLQQASPSLPITQAMFSRPALAVADGQCLTAGEKGRRAELTVREAFAAADNFEDIPLVPSRAIDKVLVRLLGEETVKTLVATLRSAANGYAIEFLRNWNTAWPSNRLLELKAAIGSPAAQRDITALTAMTAEARTLGDSHAAGMAQSVRAYLSSLYHEEVRTVEEMLLREAVLLVQGYKQYALTSEAVFFDAHSLPAEATSASKQYDAALSELDDQLSRFVAPAAMAVGGIGAHAPSPGQTVLATVFGLDELPQQ